MNTKILALAVSAALLGGCSSVGSLNPFGKDKDFTVSQPGRNTTAVKDQTVAVVNDEGIKIYYTLLGKLDRIEVYGMADAWKGDGQTLEILAEADAKERLVKYLYDQRVDSDRSVEVIARTLDKARDDALNRMENGLSPPSIVEFDEESVEAEVNAQPNSDNTSRRVAERIEETKITALTKITAGGTLRGMRKIRNKTRNNGRTYVAVYQWSEKDQDTANEIRRKMFSK
jgi:hypothetical protein